MSIPIYPVGFPNIDQNTDTEVHFQMVDGSVWRRTGYCSRCGDCCEDPENIFSSTDGNGEANPLTQEVPGKCAYYKMLPDGKHGCTGMTTQYYKNGCAYLPSKPEHVAEWPNCTYRFERIS